MGLGDVQRMRFKKGTDSTPFTLSIVLKRKRSLAFKLLKLLHLNSDSQAWIGAFTPSVAGPFIKMGCNRGLSCQKLDFLPRPPWMALRLDLWLTDNYPAAVSLVWCPGQLKVRKSMTSVPCVVDFAMFSDALNWGRVPRTREGRNYHLMMWEILVMELWGNARHTLGSGLYGSSVSAATFALARSARSTEQSMSSITITDRFVVLMSSFRSDALEDTSVSSTSYTS